jgi:two-component system, OmpR family, response regulator BaeR
VNCPSAPPIILVVEDQPKLARLLADYLAADGFAPRCVGDGKSAVAEVRKNEAALMLLDLMLPGKDGLAVCRDVRSFTGMPIIMITARADEIDRLLGLELGADDYICKPFSPREVVARVRAVLRRVTSDGAAGARRLALDQTRCEVTLDGRRVGLTPVEFRLLKTLASSPGRIHSRDQLLDSLYEDRRVVLDRTVDTHVKNVRRKLAAIAPDEEIIRSTYGVGYSLDLD